MPWIFSMDIQIQKQVEVQYGARGSTAYGNRYVYDQVQPQAPVRFRGELITDSELTTLKTAVLIPMDQAGNLVTLSVQGVNYRGNIIGLNATRIMGTEYWEVEVTLFEAEIVG